jgi:hypothetical protein
MASWVIGWKIEYIAEAGIAGAASLVDSNNRLDILLWSCGNDGFEAQKK